MANERIKLLPDRASARFGSLLVKLQPTYRIAGAAGKDDQCIRIVRIEFQRLTGELNLPAAARLDGAVEQLSSAMTRPGRTGRARPAFRAGLRHLLFKQAVDFVRRLQARTLDQRTDVLHRPFECPPGGIGVCRGIGPRFFLVRFEQFGNAQRVLRRSVQRWNGLRPAP